MLRMRCAIFDVHVLILDGCCAGVAKNGLAIEGSRCPNFFINR